MQVLGLLVLGLALSIIIYIISLKTYEESK